MTDFTLKIDGEPIGVIEVSDDFGVEIRADDPDIKTALTDQMTEERNDRAGTADKIDGVTEWTVTGIPVDNPFSLQMALLDLPRVISPMYTDGTVIDVDGDWEVFTRGEYVTN